MTNSLKKTLLIGTVLTALFLAAGLVMPKWLLFLSTMALSHGLVSLGIVLLMRMEWCRSARALCLPWAAMPAPWPPTTWASPMPS